MNIKKLACLIVGHKRIGLTVTYGFSNVARTECKRCGTELQFLTGVGIVGEWKPYIKQLEKEGIFKYHPKPPKKL
jgi:hypothetical protein